MGRGCLVVGFDAFRPEGRRFESHSNRLPGILPGASLAVLLFLISHTMPSCIELLFDNRCIISLNEYTANSEKTRATSGAQFHLEFSGDLIVQITMRKIAY